MAFLRKLHLYAGLVLSLLMLVFAVTGGALIFKEDIQRRQFPALGDPLRVLTAAQQATTISSILALFPGEVRMIRMPREGAALYHVYLDDGEALVNQAGTGIDGRWRWHESLVGVLSELHFHLGMSGVGRVVAGVLALALAAMVLSGLVIFWPFRARFSLNSLWPRASTRLQWARLHRDLGLLAAVPLLLFALTAAGVVFPDGARALLGAVTLSAQGDDKRPLAPSAGNVTVLDASVISTARNVFPDAKLMSYNPPANGDAVHYFRFRQPGEPHPNGRSTVYIDGRAGSLLHSYDASRAPRGDRAVNWLYPLHAVSVGGWIYTAIAVLAAIALAVISVSGPAIYLKSRRRTR